ncbi:hypothetical protein Tco_0989468 [Tanacetum coccineum]|uniref:Uncharacterized protein n=1 Tax=Tanacetum coccineum TaxID=301880 RepID=A0ABQ5EU89_9ASTR
MISIRLRKFYKKTGRRLQFDAKEPVRFDKTKVECFNCHNTGNFAREYRSKGNQESRRRDAGETLKMRKKKLSLMATALSSNIKVRYKLSRTESGLGYGNQIHEGVLSYEKEVLESVFDSRSSDVEDSHVNDRFAKNIPDFVPKPTVNEPTIVSKLKVWSDAPVIDEYESNSDDEYDDPQNALKNKGIVVSDYQHIHWNKAYLMCDKKTRSKDVIIVAVKSSVGNNGDEKPNRDTGPKTNEEPKDQEDLAFLKEIKRFKRQENEANDAAKAFRKEFAQYIKDLLLQAGAARCY